MTNLNEIASSAIQNAAWDIFKLILKFMIPSTIFTGIARYWWKTLKPSTALLDRKQTVVFWLGGIFGLTLILVSISLAFYYPMQKAAERLSPPITPSAIRGSVFKCWIPKVKDGDNVFIILNVRLTNPGKATTAWGWNLRVTLPGKQQYEYQPAQLLAGTKMEFRHDTNGPTEATITVENYLPYQLLEKTVGPDRGAAGWVIYQVTNLLSTAISTGTKLAIEIEQSDGSIRTVEHVWQ